MILDRIRSVTVTIHMFFLVVACLLPNKGSVHAYTANHRLRQPTQHCGLVNHPNGLHDQDSVLLLPNIRQRTNLWSDRNGADTDEGEKSPDELQRELDSLVGGSKASSGSSMLGGGLEPGDSELYRVPIPAFTALAVLLLSLYAMGYGIYVGLNGFPEESGLPRIF